MARDWSSVRPQDFKGDTERFSPKTPDGTCINCAASCKGRPTPHDVFRVDQVEPGGICRSCGCQQYQEGGSAMILERRPPSD